MVTYATMPYIRHNAVCRMPYEICRTGARILSTVPRTSSTLGDRAFSVAAPTLWNSLPPDIRCCDPLQSFKTLLKTHFIIRCITDTVQLCIFLIVLCLCFIVCASE